MKFEKHEWDFVTVGNKTFQFKNGIKVIKAFRAVNLPFLRGCLGFILMSKIIKRSVFL